MLFESYRGTSKFINSVWYTERFVSMVHFSDILMVLKDPRFKSCERIYNIDFFSFSQNQIFRYACLSVTNCKLLENIFDTFA